MKKLLMTGGWWACAMLAALSVSGEDALPEGALLKPLEGKSSWQVTFVYTVRRAGVNPATLTLTKTAPLWHAELTDSAGVRREAWGDGASVYSVENGEPQLTDGASFRNSEPWLTCGVSGFPDFEWIGKKNFRGHQKWEGMTCLFFQQDGENGAMAWIEETTRTPVRWVKAGEFRTFTQLAPPEDPLTLPKEIIELAAEVKKNKENNFRRTPRRSWQ